MHIFISLFIMLIPHAQGLMIAGWESLTVTAPSDFLYQFFFANFKGMSVSFSQLAWRCLDAGLKQ